jgi:hypothetical protein
MYGAHTYIVMTSAVCMKKQIGTMYTQIYSGNQFAHLFWQGGEGVTSKRESTALTPPIVSSPFHNVHNC